MIYSTSKKLFILITIVFMSACGADNSIGEQWRALNINNTVLLTLPHGKVVIELAPQFSPKHVEQFSALVKKSFYDDTKFYRVIDGFVAQAGPKEGSDKDKSVPVLAIEGQFAIDKIGLLRKCKSMIYLPELQGLKTALLWQAIIMIVLG